MIKAFNGLRPFNLRSVIASKPSLIQQAIAVLRRFGTNAHIYLPGVGMLNGLQAANFIDSAGTQAGAVDQPVGLVLDAAGGLGVELIADSGIDSDAFWSKGAGWSVSGGVATRVTTGSFSNLSPAANSLLTIGKTYVASADIVSISGDALIFAGMPGCPSFATSGAKQFVFVATGSAIYLQAVGAATNAVVSSFSVREVTGIHGQQATTSAKPILRRGAVNLALNSKDFTQATWNKENGSAPTATKYVEDTSNTYHRINDGGTPAPVVGQMYTYFVDASYSGRFLVLNLGATLGQKAAFDLQAGSVTQLQGSGAQILHLGSGVYRCSVTGVAIAIGQKYIGTNSTASDGPYVGDGASGVNLAGAALFQGTYTAAQIQALGGIPTTTTAPASTALGPQYWQFGGVLIDDSLSLGSVPFQMSDDFAMVAGARVDNLSSTVAISSSASTSTANPLLEFGVASGGLVRLARRDDAGVVVVASSLTGATASTPFVASARKTGVNTVARINSVSGVLDTSAALGATSLNSASIGCRPIASPNSYLAGNIYPVIAIKGTVPDADLLLLEKFVGQLSGVQI